MDHNDKITSAKDEDSLPDSPPTHLPIVTRARVNRAHTEFPQGPPGKSNSNPSNGGIAHPSSAGQLPSYWQPQTTPPPPPPPSNVGFVPTLLPRNANPNLAGNYMNMPPPGASAHGQSGRPMGFDMGLGAGALAAGALIFGDDFMSGFDVPAGFQDTSVTVSVDPPF